MVIIIVQSVECNHMRCLIYQLSIFIAQNYLVKLLRLLLLLNVPFFRLPLQPGHSENAPYITGLTTLFDIPKKNIADIKSSPN